MIEGFLFSSVTVSPIILLILPPDLLIILTGHGYPNWLLPVKSSWYPKLLFSLCIAGRVLTKRG